MRIALALVAVALLAVACGGNADNGNGQNDGGDGWTPAASTAKLVVSGADGASAELDVELAVTSEERARGLMLREALPRDGGMLFVFPGDTTTPFWMKDTPLPLSIAFIAADGEILDVQDMEPLTTELHKPPVAYRYALEVSQGWFAENGFESGGRVEIPEGLDAAT